MWMGGLSLFQNQGNLLESDFCLPQDGIALEVEGKGRDGKNWFQQVALFSPRMLDQSMEVQSINQC